MWPDANYDLVWNTVMNISEEILYTGNISVGQVSIDP